MLPATSLHKGYKTNPALIPTAMLKVKQTSVTTAKAGMDSEKSVKSILVIGSSINKPTMISAGPYACLGIAATKGAKNRVSAKQAAVTSAVKPVRPPDSIPVADST